MILIVTYHIVVVLVYAIRSCCVHRSTEGWCQARCLSVAVGGERSVRHIAGCTRSMAALGNEKG